MPETVPRTMPRTLISVRGGVAHARAVIVVVFMTLALASWMLVGVLAAGISALFERVMVRPFDRRRARSQRAQRASEPAPSDPDDPDDPSAPPSGGSRVWTLPEWMQA